MATDESKSSPTPAQAPDSAPAEGEASAAPSAWELFLDAHHKKLLIAGVAVVVAIFAGIIIQHRAQARIDAAATAFSSATTIAEFEAVSREHQGTPAGGNALLMKADLELKEGKLNESQATLTSFIASYPGHLLYHQGLFALGVQATAKGDLDEAEKYFQQVINDDNAIDLAPLAVIRSGDIAYERGNFDEARDLYESVNPTYPGTPYGIIAQQKLQRKALLPPAPKPVPAPVPIPAPVKAGAPAAEKLDAATKPTGEKAKQKGKKDASAPADKASPKAAKPSE